MALSDFIQEVTGDSHLRVEDDLGDGFVRLRSAEAERRQAKHDIRSVEDIVIEMLRNARDAHARNIFVAVSRSESLREIVMLDDGDGIPLTMRELIFEPRVTSKLDSVHMDTWGIHGRGMALYSIKVNAKSAHVAESIPEGGSSIVVVADTSMLPEKKDQSTVPEFFRDAEGIMHIRGPRNIVRTVSEFAFLDKGSCTVYCGSPSEIAATLYEFGKMSLSKSSRVFSTDRNSIPVCKRLACAGDPSDFRDIASSIGLDLSERTARRILDGTIHAIDDTASQIHVAGASKSHGKKRTTGIIAGDSRGLDIADADLASFEQQVQNAFSDLAQAYYLDENVQPDISVRNGLLSVKLPLRNID